MRLSRLSVGRKSNCEDVEYHRGCYQIHDGELRCQVKGIVDGLRASHATWQFACIYPLAQRLDYRILATNDDFNLYRLEAFVLIQGSYHELASSTGNLPTLHQDRWPARRLPCRRGRASATLFVRGGGRHAWLENQRGRDIRGLRGRGLRAGLWGRSRSGRGRQRFLKCRLGLGGALPTSISVPTILRTM